MKTSDIVIKEKCIVLGLFETRTFYTISSINNVRDWASFSNLPRTLTSYTSTSGIVRVVENACFWAEQIIFVLDDVQFPIDIERSITCEELALVCRNDEFFNKTIFVKREEVINFDKNLI
jgi:hypothetical protein